jgi:flagellar biosynthesis protein FliR
MFRGHAWEVNLAIALSYSILMGALLLIPTDIMPATIRLGHFVEVALSNFIFGWLVGAILQLPGKARPEPV